MGITTGFVRPDGFDIGTNLVEKTYLIDRYPELADTFKQAGLWLWGRNGAQGILGTNNTSNRSSPVQTIATGANWNLVSCGQYHSAAIKTDNSLWTWGLNSYGRLGDNTITSRSSPIQTISSTTDWKQVSCGTHHTTAIKTDGTLWAWGRNANGQLGDNTNLDKSSPVQTVSGGMNWKQVVCGNAHTAAIKTDGTLWTWGFNAFGQLGDNTTANKSSPVQTVAGGTNWNLVSTNGTPSTSAIKTDGTLWLWGRNNFSQLGDNTAINRSSPVQTVSTGNTWKLVSSSGYHAAAIKTDGTLWIWGFNSFGQLGDNTTANKSSPVQTVAGGTNWKTLSSGFYHVAAIKSDGSLWAWGTNGYGRLGTNNLTSYSSPVQTIAAGTNWKLVSCGNYHTAAIRDDSSDPI